MNYFLLVTKYDFLVNIFFFSSLFLSYFGEVKKFKVILIAKSTVSRLVRMCLAELGFGSGLLRPVYYRPNKCSIKLYFSSTFI